MEVNIVTFVLDDSKIELLLMERSFNAAKIPNTMFFTNEEDFWSHYHKDVHIAVLDYNIRPNTGLNIAEKLLEKNPYCKIIIHSAIEDADIVMKALNMGIYKWFTKTDSDHLEKCIDGIKKAIETMKPFLEYQQLKNQYA